MPLSQRRGENAPGFLLPGKNPGEVQKMKLMPVFDFPIASLPEREQFFAAEARALAEVWAKGHKAQDARRGTVREQDASWNNRALRLLARTGFSSTELHRAMAERLDEFFSEGRMSSAQRALTSVVSGLRAAVDEVVVWKLAAHRPQEEYFLGTHDVLDAEYKIDFVVLKRDLSTDRLVVVFEQLKSASMSAREMDEVRSAHQKFLDRILSVTRMNVAAGQRQKRRDNIVLLEATGLQTTEQIIDTHEGALVEILTHPTLLRSFHRAGQELRAEVGEAFQDIARTCQVSVDILMALGQSDLALESLRLIADLNSQSPEERRKLHAKADQAAIAWRAWADHEILMAAQPARRTAKEAYEQHGEIVRDRSVDFESLVVHGPTRTRVSTALLIGPIAIKQAA